MSNERLINLRRSHKAGLALSALAAAVALALLLHGGGKAASVGTARSATKPLATSRAASPATNTDRRQPTPTPAHANPVSPAADKPKLDLAAHVSTFLDYATNYQQQDRASVIDEALAKVVAGGAQSVFELQRQLGDATVYEQAKRAAAFHALERIGRDLVRSSDSEAQRALLAIQSMAKTELALPTLIVPNPEMDVDMLPQSTREELLHQGILVERDGELLQPTALNKLPVIRLLRSIGGDMSRVQLKQLAAASDNPPGVQLAAEQAIELASR